MIYIFLGVTPEMQERSVNSQFYKSITHVTNLYPITGSLSGQLIEDECSPFKVSGVLSGELTYHTLDNVEESPTWQIAPQVGDFFKLQYGEIEEEYEITQLYDRTLTNQGRNKSFIRKIYISMFSMHYNDQEQFYILNIYE